QCSDVRIRREWRNLPLWQRDEYLHSVRCLKSKPSRIGLNHSLYDDFPWTHSRVGKYVHDAAPFLAWHRYFVVLYEETLQNVCSYTGSMPYWDWELDWEDITKSPIWDAEHGFGTNGRPEESREPIVQGYCVRDGPFRDFEIPYLDETMYPHCLSRGFLAGDELGLQAQQISPDMMDQLLAITDYGTFNLRLENGPHLAIPRTIRGDFSLLTAPSDPVFFLHHTQLDRLWWNWQRMNGSRLTDYSGVRTHNGKEPASSFDLLLMGGLAPDIPVAEVLHTTSNRLCYIY
ncbi:Di-copper centre-containing protein, partial [Westerdykella ornata]